MSPFPPPQKRRYDKGQYRQVTRDNPSATEAADKAFFAKHPELKSDKDHPFKVHRPDRFAAFLNLDGEKEKREQIRKRREEYWAFLREAEILEKGLRAISREVGHPVVMCGALQKHCRIEKVTLQCGHHHKRSYSLNLPPDDKTWKNNPNRAFEVVGGGKSARDSIKVSVTPPHSSRCSYHKSHPLLVQNLEDATLKINPLPLPGSRGNLMYLPSSEYTAGSLDGLRLSIAKPTRYLVRPRACSLEKEDGSKHMAAIVAVYPDLQWDVDLEINLPELIGFSGGIPRQNVPAQFLTGLHDKNAAIISNSVVQYCATVSGQPGLKGKFAKKVNGRDKDLVGEWFRSLNTIFGWLGTILGIVIFIWEIIDIIISAAQGKQSSEVFYEQAGFLGPAGGWGLSGSLSLASVAKLKYKAHFEEYKNDFKVGLVYEWSVGLDPLIRLKLAIDITGLIIQIIAGSTSSITSGGSPIAGYIINKLRTVSVGSTKGYLGYQHDVLSATFTLSGAISGTLGMEKPHPHKPARQKEEAGFSVKGKIDGTLEIIIVRAKGVIIKYGFDFGVKGGGTTAISAEIKHQVEDRNLPGKGECEFGNWAMDAQFHGLYVYFVGWLSIGSNVALFHDTGEKPTHATEEWADKVLEEKIKGDIKKIKIVTSIDKLGKRHKKAERKDIERFKAKGKAKSEKGAWSLGAQTSFAVFKPTKIDTLKWSEEEL